MEEKKFDLNSIIGFVLIFGILLFMLWQNKKTPEQIAADKAKQEQVEADKKAEEASQKTASWVLGIVWAIMFFLIVIAQGSGEQFIYFQF